MVVVVRIPEDNTKFGKKGQITVFIILGILLLFVFALIFYLSSSSTLSDGSSYDTLGEVSSSTSVQEYVESCLEEATLESIYVTLSQGGYYDIKQLGELNYYSDSLELLTLPYYFDQGELLNPELETIESEVSSGATILFEECVDDFSAFSNLGYTIESSTPVVIVQFLDGWTTVDMDFRFVLSIEESSQEFESFSLTYPFSLPEKIDEIESYLETQEEDTIFFQVGFLSSASYFGGYDFYYGYSETDEGVVFVSYSYDEELWDEPLLLNFALLFDVDDADEDEAVLELLDEETSLELSSLSSTEIYEWNVTTERISYYKFPVEGVLYELDPETDGLDIDVDTGILELNGDEFPNDNYLLYVHVESEDGFSVGYPLIINVNIDYNGDFPLFIAIETQEVLIGEEFIYTVELENPTVGTSYSVDNSFIVIDSETGEMNFTATEDLLGTHIIRVDSENELGANWMTFVIEVKEE